jgi:DNA repair exonuclease SbcCD ATPase subunit
MSSLKRKSAEDEAVVGRVVEGPTDLTGGPMGKMLRDYEKKIEEFEEQIKNHVEEMAKKDEEIEVTKTQLQEMNQRFTQQTVQVQEKNIEIMKLQAEIAKKDEMIAQQGVEIAEKTKMSDDMDITRDSHEGGEYHLHFILLLYPSRPPHSEFASRVLVRMFV